MPPQSIAEVRSYLRSMDLDDFPVDTKFDLAEVALRHSYKPSVNVMNVEFSIPAIRKQMPYENYVNIGKQMANSKWHGLEYNEVDNNEFRSFIKKEKTRNIRIFDEDGKRWITYYFSTDQRVLAMPYDYEAMLSIYMLYPSRDFQKRTPCTRLSSKCIYCLDLLNEDVDDFYGAATIDQYWHNKPGDFNNLIVAYTIETEFENDFENLPESNYYVMDMTHDYFKKGIPNEAEWGSKILRNRLDSNETWYSTNINIGTKIGEVDTYYSSLFACEYDASDIKEQGIDTFTKLSELDMKILNGRNTWQKHIYNTWIETLKDADDGWYCGWSGDEISTALGGAGATAVGDEIANAMGWDSSSSGNSDSTYTLITEKFPNYVYTVEKEAINMLIP